MSNVQIGAGTLLTPSSNPYGPALLSTFEDDKGRVWIKGKAAAAIAQGEWVAIDELGNAALLTKALADAGHQIAIAQVAFASAYYGWFARKGYFSYAKGLTSCAADVPLYTSATAGAADDSSSSQTEIKGARLVTAVGGGGAENKDVLLAVEPHV